MFAHGESVDVLTAATIPDPYSGEESPSWSVDPASVTVDDVGVEPRPEPGAERTQDARNAVVSGFTLYMPTGTAINAKNRVIVRGNTYEVDGEPAVWRSPFTGWEPGVVVQTKRVEG